MTQNNMRNIVIEKLASADEITFEEAQKQYSQLTDEDLIDKLLFVVSEDLLICI